MVKLLFVLMNEYRLWALPQALAALERRYPGAVEGRVYSVREINADAGLERALLADGAAADMAFLASHGSIQNLYCFSRLWEALEGRPVYFTSTMGDELAELLPRLGLEPALYAALDSYYQAGSPADLEGLVLCALNGRRALDYKRIGNALIEQRAEKQRNNEHACGTQRNAFNCNPPQHIAHGGNKHHYHNEKRYAGYRDHSSE